MTRLLIIGNSHVGALRRAYDIDAGDLRGVALDYVGAAVDTARDFRVEGTILRIGGRPDSEQNPVAVGVTGPELTAYDGFVVVGLGVRFVALARLYETHRLFEHADADVSVISRAAFDACIDQTVRDSPAFYLAQCIRGVSDKPLLLIAEPYPAEVVKSDARWTGCFDNPGHLRFLRSAFETHVSRVFASLNVRFVPQDESTMIDDVFTRAEYREDADGQPRRARKKIDFRHMNERYGKIMLARATEQLRDLSVLAPSPDGARTGAASLETP